MNDEVLYVYGGSCSKPIHLDADIYVGLDTSMKQTDKEYPWTIGYEIGFYIRDMQTPTDDNQFKKLIEWLSVQLIAKEKIHIGCIGGHGRTGFVLAALYFTLTGDKNAIEYVRTNYCKKAVESQAQVDYLHTNFGIAKVKATKSDLYFDDYSITGKKSNKVIPINPMDAFSIDSLPSNLSIW